MSNAMIELQNLHYARFEQKILNDITITINQGDFVILVGPNGSGKSTLVKVLNGMVKPDSGQVLIHQNNIARWPMHKIANLVATLTQDLRHSTFSELSVAMNLELALNRSGSIVLHSREEKADYLRSFSQTLPERLNVLAGNLSGGQRQCLALAMCFAHKPKVLLLDEHTSALDPKAASHLMALTNSHILEKKLTTILITHSLDHAMQYGDRLLAMNEGRIIADLSATQKAHLSKNDLVNLAY